MLKETYVYLGDPIQRVTYCWPFCEYVNAVVMYYPPDKRKSQLYSNAAIIMLNVKISILLYISHAFHIQLMPTPQKTLKM